MSLNRPVRDDQHGTLTGYTYGCRCRACGAVRREYTRTHDREVSPELVELVLAALEHEADLDGISTASAERLGELAEVSHTSANQAVQSLAAQGRVKIVGRVGRGGALEVHLGLPA